MRDYKYGRGLGVLVISFRDFDSAEGYQLFFMDIKKVDRGDYHIFSDFLYFRMANWLFANGKIMYIAKIRIQSFNTSPKRDEKLVKNRI